MSLQIEICISAAEETKTKLATLRSACATAMLKLETETKPIKAKRENTKKLLDQSRRTMRQHTQTLTKLDSISDELNPLLEKLLSFQRHHVAQAGFRDKLMRCYLAQNFDEMDVDEDLKLVEELIAMNVEIGPVLARTRDVLVDMKWDELEMVPNLPAAQPTDSVMISKQEER